jgi:hypothetical protein
MNPDSLHYLG